VTAACDTSAPEKKLAEAAEASIIRKCVVDHVGSLQAGRE
jgi:hypothetical protein